MSTTSLHNQQSGLVSIIVAIIFITIISLVTTSFALLSRREQRQALDRQLSTQAFYAAESGINDAIEKAKAGPINISDCNAAGSLSDSGSQLDDSLSYTCVLVDEKPKSLEFAPVSTDDSTIVKVQAAVPIGKIRISWQDFEGSKVFADNDKYYLPQASWNTDHPDTSYANNTGILRTTVIPVTTGMTRQSLVDNSQTLFLYPKESTTAGQSGEYTYQTGQASQGAYVEGKCNEDNNSAARPRYCNADINGLSGTTTYYIRLKGIYRSSRVTIQAFDTSGSDLNPLALESGQIVVDATGKATDVLRRVQVRVPVFTTYKTPEAALETTETICKKIEYTQNATTDLCEPYN